MTFTTPTVEGPTYTFDNRRTQHHACNSPLIPDPYEMGTIAIKKSKLHGSGEGVFLKVDVPAGNQIYLVTFMCLTVDTSFVFTKKSNVAKWFFDIFNAEIAQCRQKLDIILVTK